jgi:hypothetical protein
MKKTKGCKIIIFSDIHYLDERPKKLDSNLNRKLTQYSVAILEKLINEINNKYKPDVGINLGDLIEDTCNHNKDIVNLNYIWNKLKNMKCPFYSAIGNHDLRTMNSRREVEEIMGYKHSTFSININGYHLVILGTDIMPEIGIEGGGIFKTQFISNEDIEWLKNDLSKNELPCLIFTHFGLAEDNMKNNYWFDKDSECALLRNRKDVKKVIKNQKNVLAVFSGHQHWTKMIEEDGIKYYVLGSITENINNNGVPDGVYLEVDLENKTIKVTEHHIVI